MVTKQLVLNPRGIHGFGFSLLVDGGPCLEDNLFPGSVQGPSTCVQAGDEA